MFARPGFIFNITRNTIVHKNLDYFVKNLRFKNIMRTCDGVNTTSTLHDASGAQHVDVHTMPIKSDVYKNLAMHHNESDVISVAPMMDYTDHHFRQLVRLISTRVKLYTEMVVDTTILNAPNIDQILYFDPIQHPIACQLGGNNPEKLRQAAQVICRHGYDEINLNCGCPSNKVANKSEFGARLMFQPELVAQCVSAIKEVCDPLGVAVTVKCRLGADDVDSYEELKDFVRIVSETGVSHFIVHARKCLLQGLSTADNRKIPKLKYHWVLRLANDFPSLQISLNGGIKSIESSERLLSLLPRTPRLEERHFLIDDAGRSHDTVTIENDTELVCGAELDPMWPRLYRFNTEMDDKITKESDSLKLGYGLLSSIMIGREAYTDPWMFARVDRRFFGVTTKGVSRKGVLDKYLDYVDRVMGTNAYSTRDERLQQPCPATILAKPIFKLFHGCRGGAAFRRRMNYLINDQKQRNDLRLVVENAIQVLDEDVLNEITH